MKKPKVSIIILSYNTKGLLRDCLNSLKAARNEIPFEVIVSDNGSKDESVEMVKEDFDWVKLVENKKNLGFAAGNNAARGLCKGEYVLFLNSDTEVKKGAIKETVKYLDEHKDVGAIGCKIVLTNGRLDQDARRSFPTPWVALTHFSGLDRVFPKSKLLARYWYGYKSENEVHEVDVLQGAFFLARKKVLDQVDWFDEDYFLDGEDIDLCWKIKEAGYKIIYYPKVSIIHIKKASKKKNDKVKFSQRLKFVMAGVNSMEIFYKKRLWKKYPLFLNLLVLLGIRVLKAIRYIKSLLS
jgi:hypothetical protein